MSESYDDIDEPVLDDEVDTADVIGNAEADDLSALSAKYSGPAPNSIAEGYRAAIERLKAQRSGLSTKEKIAAALIGFGQPTQHGTRGAIANAAKNLMVQTSAARKRDDSRDALIAKYLAEEPVKQSAAQAAIDRIAATRAATDARAKTAAGKPPPSRLGYARLLFPGLSDQELVSQGKLFGPEVDKKLLQFTQAQTLARDGEPIEEETEVVETPTLEVFLPAARAKNPGVPDEELIAFYTKKYGGK